MTDGLINLFFATASSHPEINRVARCPTQFPTVGQRMRFGPDAGASAIAARSVLTASTEYIILGSFIPPASSGAGREAGTSVPASASMNTYVYVDGFNFYYRVVKGTKYKWLDLSALCRLLLRQHRI